MSRDIVVGLKFRKPTAKGLDGAAIAQMFEDGYLASRRPSKWTQKKTFSPSSIGGYNGVCPRYWYLAFEGNMFEEKTDALGVATMANGTAAHDRLQKALELGGNLIASEVEITLQDPPIRGFLDAIVNWDGEEVVGEFKTTRSESFVFKQTTGKPAANHLIQLLIYLRATGKQRGFILYENRNDQTVVVIPVEMNETNEKILDDVLEWLRTVRKAWEDKTIPKPVFRKNNKICKACPLENVCWNQAPSGEVDIPKMGVPKI